MLSAREPDKSNRRDKGLIDDFHNSNNGDADEEDVRVDIRSMPLSGRRGGGGGGVHALWKAADDGGSAGEFEPHYRVSNLRE